MLGQNFGACINSRELCQDAILMTSSYTQNCLWPALVTTAAGPILLKLGRETKGWYFGTFFEISSQHGKSKI